MANAGQTLTLAEGWLKLVSSRIEMAMDTPGTHRRHAGRRCAPIVTLSFVLLTIWRKRVRFGCPPDGGHGELTASGLTASESWCMRYL